MYGTLPCIVGSTNNKGANMKIILLSGKKGAGKDIVSDILGYDTYHFADALKTSAGRTFNINQSFFYDRDLKDSALLQYPVQLTDATTRSIMSLFIDSVWVTDEGIKYHTPRTLALIEGAMRRLIDKDYWVKKTLADVESDMKIYDEQVAVIADWRFPNEAEYIKDNFKGQTITVRVNRPGFDNSHDASETALDDYNFDYVIDNDKSLEWLKSEVDTFLRKIS